MDAHLRKIIRYLMNRNVIGHKHMPERLLIHSRIKHLSRDEQRSALEEYHKMLSSGIFWRLMKRTGRGSEWHISINPDRLSEINEMMGDEDETANREIL